MKSVLAKENGSAERALTGPYYPKVKKSKRMSVPATENGTAEQALT